MEFLLQLFSYSNNSFVFFLKEPQRHVNEREKETIEKIFRIEKKMCKTTTTITITKSIFCMQNTCSGYYCGLHRTLSWYLKRNQVRRINEYANVRLTVYVFQYIIFICSTQVKYSKIVDDGMTRWCSFANTGATALTCMILNMKWNYFTRSFLFSCIHTHSLAIVFAFQFSPSLFFKFQMITCTENTFGIALLWLLRTFFFFFIDLMPNHFILSILFAYLRTFLFFSLYYCSCFHFFMFHCIKPHFPFPTPSHIFNKWAACKFFYF